MHLDFIIVKLKCKWSTWCLNWACTTLHQALHIYSMASRLVFLLDSWVCKMGGSLLIIPSLIFFSFCWSVLSNFVVAIFVLSYFAIFYYLFRSPFFSERQKGSRSKWKWGGTGKSRGRRNCNQDILNEKRIYYSLKEEMPGGVLKKRNKQKGR